MAKKKQKKKRDQKDLPAQNKRNKKKTKKPSLVSRKKAVSKRQKKKPAKPDTTITSSEKREILKKNLILAGIVCLLVAINLWVYLFRGRQAKTLPTNIINNNQATEQPATNPSPPGTDEQSANDKIVQSLLEAKKQESWKIYQNQAYGFEIKYPQAWADPVVSDPQAGYKFRFKVTFREKSDSNGPANGLDIYIYRNTLPSSKILKADYSDNIVVKDTAARDYSNCNMMEVFSVGVEEYPAVQVNIQPNDPCFQEAYFFSLKKGYYIFDIVPYLKSGINYGGFDGEKKVNAEFPVFYKVLATLNFPAVRKTLANPTSVTNPAVKPKVEAPRVSGGIRCPEKIQHPHSSSTKGKHTDEDCCPDPDEYPKAGCAYSAHDFSIMLKRK